jgi:tetratricopeptide (TPR) repeat protein
LVIFAILGALEFWANVGGIRSWLQGDQVAKLEEALPGMIREETRAVLSEFIDGRAPKALEIPIVTEDKFIQEQQEKLRAGRVNEVIRAIEQHRVERVAEYSGLLARAYLQKGDIEFHADRFNRAERFFRDSLREAQSSGEKEIIAECYLELGAAVGMQSKYQEAQRCFAETIMLKPDFAEAYHNRGVVYAHKGEYDLVIADCDKAIDLKPDFAEAYYNRGLAYARKREYNLAIADLRRTIELEPDLPRGERGKSIMEFVLFLELVEDKYWQSVA